MKNREDCVWLDNIENLELRRSKTSPCLGECLCHRLLNSELSYAPELSVGCKISKQPHAGKLSFNEFSSILSKWSALFKDDTLRGLP